MEPRPPIEKVPTQETSTVIPRNEKLLVTKTCLDFISKVKELYLDEKEVTIEELELESRKILDSEDGLRRGLRTPHLEMEILKALANLCGDFFPRVKGADYLHNEDTPLEKRYDEILIELKFMAIRLTNEHIKGNGTRIASDLTSYDGCIFIVETALGSFFDETPKEVRENMRKFVLDNFSSFQDIIDEAFRVKPNQYLPDSFYIERGIQNYYLGTIECVLAQSSKEEFLALYSKLSKYFTEDEYSPSKAFDLLFSHAFFRRWLDTGQLTENGLELTKNILRQVGLAFDEMINAWLQGSPEPGKTNGGDNDQSNDFRHIVEKNLSVILEIESEFPGISKTLHDMYGISNFARFSKNFLTEQYSKREDTNTPYGVIILPKDDHNGAFYQDVRLFDDLLNKVREHLNVRAVECGSKMDIGRKLIELKRKYGEDGKRISFCLLGGHGSKESIRFGALPLPTNTTPNYEDLGEESRSILHIEDLSGQGIGRVGGEFFADEMAKTLGVNVTAPDRTCSLMSISVSFDDNNVPIFDATYSKDTQAVTYSGTK